MSDRWIQSAVLAAVFLVAGSLGHLVAIPPGLATPIWLPSGLTVAAFIVLGARLWPGVLIGAALVSWEAIVQLDSGAAIARSFAVLSGVAGSVLIEPLLAARLYVGLRRDGRLLSHPRNVSVLLFIAAPVSCLVTSLLASLVLAASGSIPWAGFSETCTTWMIGDLAGIYMLTPALLTWADGTEVDAPLDDRPLAAVSVAILALVCAVAFLDIPPFGGLETLDYIPIPLMIYVAYRFSDRVASLVGPAVALSAVVAAANGFGLFGHGSTNRSLIALQLFVLVGIMTALFARSLANQRDTAEREAQRLSADLAHLSRVTMMGEMAAGMAHEYHQPLAAITNYASICLIKLRAHEDAYRDVHDPLEHIAEEALRAGDIVNRLKDFLRKREPERTLCNANEVVADAIRLTRVAHSFANTTLRFEPTPDLPSVEVDRVQMTQILVNLLVNSCEAIEATNQHDGEVRVVMARMGEDRLRICIEDNGPGMDEKVARTCFDQFFSTKQRGLGVGLGVSRALAQAHGGNLYCDPASRRGARFYLELPLPG